MTIRAGVRSRTRWLAAVVVGAACAPAAALSPVADFGANPGALSMFEHVPALVEGVAGGMPLVLVLHGCSQDERYAEASGLTALADEFGFGLVVGVQRLGNNSQACFNWFEEDDIDSGEGETASLTNMVLSFMARHDVDADRVFVTGLSSGGAMTAVLLAAEPTLFAAGASFAGVPYRCGVGLGAAFGCLSGPPTRSQSEWAALVEDHVDHDTATDGPWPRLLIVHGADDGTVDSDNSAALALQWSGLHGLPAAPTSSSIQVGSAGDRTVSTWTVGGVDVVEQVVIAGMDHGVPVDPPSCGVAAPFFVDVEFCGSRAALDFFGLTEPEGEGEGEGEGVGAEGEGEDGGAEGEGEAAEGEGEGVGAEGKGEAVDPGCACASDDRDEAGVVVCGATLLLAQWRRKKRTISSVVRSPG